MIDYCYLRQKNMSNLLKSHLYFMKKKCKKEGLDANTMESKWNKILFFGKYLL